MGSKNLTWNILRVLLICSLVLSSSGILITQNALAAAPSGSMAAATLYLKNNQTKAINAITVIDSGAEITAANDIRILIPATFSDLTWDASDTTATIDTTGNATGVVSTTVSYATTNYGNDTLVLDVTTDFTTGDTVTVSDLSLISGNPATENTQSLNWSVDGGSNYGFGSANVIVDTTAPSGYSISIDQSYINSFNETNTTFTFSSAEVGATYNYSVDDTNGATPAVIGSGTAGSANQTIGAINVSSLDDDTLTYTVYLTDLAGNQGANATDTVTKDTSAPTYTINEGTAAGPVKSDTINVTVADTNLAAASLTYGFSADNTCDGTDTYPNSFINSIDFYIGGDHTDYLCLTASDTPGNTSYQLVGQLNTDNTPPTVTDANISIAGGTGTGSAYIVGDTVTVTWDNSGAGDNNTDLNNATVDLTGWGGLPAFLMTDTTACGGTNADNIYEACYTILGTEGIDGTNINVTVTATDNANNSSGAVGDTTNATVDTIIPTFVSSGLSISTDNGIVGVAAVNGGSVAADAVNVNASLAAADGDTITWNATPIGGNPLQANNTPSTLSVGVTDNANQDFSVTATDNAGNSNTFTTFFIDGSTIAVDNQVPTVTTGCISVTGATGTAGAFKVADAPVPTWDNTAICDNNADTITNVVFDASAFYAPNTAVPGTNAAGLWTGTLTGPVDSQDDTNNNITVAVYDNGGNRTAVTGTNNYTIDTQLPSFTAVQTVEALKQDGTAPTASTTIWYYYPTQNLRLQVNNASETDGNDLVSVKACMRSMNEDVPAQTCSLADFANPANYQSLTINAGTDDSTLNYALAGLPSGWPTQVDSYEMNFELTDDAGNVWWSANAAEFYHAVFNVDPKVIYTGTPDINNATTTDWATITDFTAATNVVFNANDGTNDVGRITITGPVNLTTPTAISELQNLATNMTVTGDQGTGAIDAKIDSANLSIFDTGASLMIRVPSGAAQPGIVVRDDADAIAGYIQSGSATGSAGGDNLTAITWNAGTQELTFTTDGFTSFGADQTAPTETITPANASTGVATTTPIVVTFSEEMDTSSFTYTLVPSPGGEVVTWSAGDTVATINHTAFANSTSYTFTVTAANDMVGNPSAGSASTFTTVAATTTTTSSGGAGGRAPILTTTTTTTTESYEAPAEFTDVAGHWAEDYINQAKDEGYIQGYEDETFKPDQNITRSEAAKLIAMWLDSSIGEDTCVEGQFSDVSCGVWYAKYVIYLNNAGIIEGYADGTFAPANYINRAEALKMMLFAKALQDSGIADVINPFSDVSMTDWFYNYVMVGYKLSIIQGYEDGTFGPGRNITRAEFTKIFVETLLNN